MRMHFAVGFASGTVLALALNLFPYWHSYGAYGTDGYEVIGFPLIFRRFGGFRPIYEFRFDVLLIDIAVGVVIALAAGLGVMKVLSLLGRHARRGFHVVEKPNGGPAAA